MSEEENYSVKDFSNGIMNGVEQSAAGALANVGRIPNAPYSTENNKNPFPRYAVDLYNSTLGYPNNTEAFQDGLYLGKQILPNAVAATFRLGYPGTILTNVALNSGLNYLEGKPYGATDFLVDVAANGLAKLTQDKLKEKDYKVIEKIAYPSMKAIVEKVSKLGKAKASEIDEDDEDDLSEIYD